MFLFGSSEKKPAEVNRELFSSFEVTANQPLEDTSRATLSTILKNVVSGSQYCKENDISQDVGEFDPPVQSVEDFLPLFASPFDEEGNFILTNKKNPAVWKLSGGGNVCHAGEQSFSVPLTEAAEDAFNVQAGLAAHAAETAHPSAGGCGGGADDPAPPGGKGGGGGLLVLEWAPPAIEEEEEEEEETECGGGGAEAPAPALPSGSLFDKSLASGSGGGGGGGVFERLEARGAVSPREAFAAPLGRARACRAHAAFALLRRGQVSAIEAPSARAAWELALVLAGPRPGASGGVEDLAEDLSNGALSGLPGRHPLLQEALAAACAADEGRGGAAAARRLRRERAAGAEGLLARLFPRCRALRCPAHGPRDAFYARRLARYLGGIPLRPTEVVSPLVPLGAHLETAAAAAAAGHAAGAAGGHGEEEGGGAGSNNGDEDGGAPLRRAPSWRRVKKGTADETAPPGYAAAWARSNRYVLVPTCAYYEFLLLDQHPSGDEPQVVGALYPMAALRFGSTYEVVATTFAGLIRCRTGHAVRPTGLSYRQLPVLAHLGRPAMRLSLAPAARPAPAAAAPPPPPPPGVGGESPLTAAARRAAEGAGASLLPGAAAAGDGMDELELAVLDAAAARWAERVAAGVVEVVDVTFAARRNVDPPHLICYAELASADLPEKWTDENGHEVNPATMLEDILFNLEPNYAEIRWADRAAELRLALVAPGALGAVERLAARYGGGGRRRGGGGGGAGEGTLSRVLTDRTLRAVLEGRVRATIIADSKAMLGKGQGPAGIFTRLMQCRC